MVINMAYLLICRIVIYVSLFLCLILHLGIFFFFRLHWVLLDLPLQTVSCSRGMQAPKLGLPGHLTVPFPHQPILTLHLSFLFSWIILLLNTSF